MLTCDLVQCAKCWCGFNLDKSKTICREQNGSQAQRFVARMSNNSRGIKLWARAWCCFLYYKSLLLTIWQYRLYLLFIYILKYWKVSYLFMLLNNYIFNYQTKNDFTSVRCIYELTNSRSKYDQIVSRLNVFFKLTLSKVWERLLICIWK